MTERRGVVVTGASMGIGLAVARRFAAAGDGVVLTGRSETSLAAARAELASAGFDVGTVPGSVTDMAAIGQALDLAFERFGRLDVVINNAGICWEADLFSTTESQFDQLFDTNVKGMFLWTREAAARMIASGTPGVIVNTGSINAARPDPRYVAYSATKAAVEAMTRGYARELAEYGIRVCGVHPGIVTTPMFRKVLPDPEELKRWVAEVEQSTPLGWIAEPDQVAGAYYFLASNDAEYVTGTFLTVDGGFAA